MNPTAGNAVRKEFSTLEHIIKERALYAAKDQLKNRPPDLHSLDQWISKDSMTQTWNPLSLVKFCESFLFCKVHIPLFPWIHLAVCLMRITDRSLRWCIIFLSERLKGLQSRNVRTVLLEQSSKDRRHLQSENYKRNNIGRDKLEIIRQKTKGPRKQRCVSSMKWWCKPQQRQMEYARVHHQPLPASLCLDHFPCKALISSDGLSPFLLPLLTASSKALSISLPCLSGGIPLCCSRAL